MSDLKSSIEKWNEKRRAVIATFQKDILNVFADKLDEKLESEEVIKKIWIEWCKGEFYIEFTSSKGEDEVVYSLHSHYDVAVPVLDGIFEALNSFSLLKVEKIPTYHSNENYFDMEDDVPFKILVQLK